MELMHDLRQTAPPPLLLGEVRTTSGSLPSLRRRSRHRRGERGSVVGLDRRRRQPDRIGD